VVVPAGLNAPSGWRTAPVASSSACDQHPDPVGEHVRFQICEGEMLQALGPRASHHRTAESPLADRHCGRCRPSDYREQGRGLASAEPGDGAGGRGRDAVSPKDMVEVWPQIWKTVDAAKKTLGKIRASAQARRNTVPKWYI